MNRLLARIRDLFSRLVAAQLDDAADTTDAETKLRLAVAETNAADTAHNETMLRLGIAVDAAIERVTKNRETNRDTIEIHRTRLTETEMAFLKSRLLRAGQVIQELTAIKADVTARGWQALARDREAQL